MLPTITVDGQTTATTWTEKVVTIILGYGLRPGEVIYIDDDLILALSEIDEALAEQTMKVQYLNGVYNLLSSM